MCFGNSFNNEERSVCAGYDNGDIKLYDLRTNQIRHTESLHLQCRPRIATHPRRIL